MGITSWGGAGAIGNLFKVQGTEFLLCKIKRVLGMGDGDVCTICMHLGPLYLKLIKIQNKKAQTSLNFT